MKISSFNGYVGKQFNRLTNNKIMQGQFIKNYEKPAAFAMASVFISIVSKDVINCYLYTTQSWNNKKIPEDKRKFVAMTDLTNGIIMVGGQILTGILIEKKLGPKWLGKLYNGDKPKIVDGVQKFDPIVDSKAPFAPDNAYKSAIDAVEKNKQKIIKELKDFETNPNVKKDLCEVLAAKHGKDGKIGKAVGVGFSIIVVLLGTNALVKRTIAPLLSTPAASWVKKKYVDKPSDAKSKPEEKSKEEPNLDDKLLDHAVAPWAYSSLGKEKATFNKIT